MPSGREAFRFFGQSYDAFALFRAAVQIIVIVGSAVVIWMNLDFRVHSNSQAIAALHGRVQTMSDVLAQFPVHSNQMLVIEREIDALQRQAGTVAALTSTIATLTERIEALREQMHRLEEQMSRRRADLSSTYGEP